MNNGLNGPGTLDKHDYLAGGARMAKGSLFIANLTSGVLGNDYDPGCDLSTVSVLVVRPSTSGAWTGLKAGVPGQSLLVVNGSNGPIVIQAEQTTSQVRNRFAIGGGFVAGQQQLSDTLPAGGSVWLMYADLSNSPQGIPQGGATTGVAGGRWFVLGRQGTNPWVITQGPLASVQQAFNPDGQMVAGVIRLAPQAKVEIATLNTSTSAQPRLLLIQNVPSNGTGTYNSTQPQMTGYPIRFRHQDMSNNRALSIQCPGGRDYDLFPGESVYLMYDIATNMWRVVAPERMRPYELMGRGPGCSVVKAAF